jgi:hypothetical protein
MSSSEQVEKLAGEIGDQIYIDVANWHLYLRDAKQPTGKLHTILAEAFYAAIVDGSFSEAIVAAKMQTLMIKLGGGKKEMPLSDLIPTAGQTDLMRILTEFQRNL